MQPLLDANGKLLKIDHPGISANDWVIRRVPNHWRTSDPKFPEGERISSLAWEESSDGGMSVDLESLITTEGIDSVEYYKQMPTAAIKMKVGEIRALTFTVGYDPVKGDPVLADNTFHCQVWGQFSRGKKNALRNISEWHVALQGVSLGRDFEQIKQQ